MGRHEARDTVRFGTHAAVRKAKGREYVIVGA